MAAGVVRQSFGPQVKKPTPVEDQYRLYSTAVEKQAGDYDNIMRNYRTVFDEAGSPGSYSNKFSPYKPELATYTKSADTASALANLQDLSATGGLSAADQQNLRARGVSPIRSMYATAKRDMDRQRNLSGGYSPNYGAVTSKMTRDQSSLIADRMDSVNAGIAEMVQRGRLSAAPQYAGAAQSEADLKARFDLSNRDAKNDAARFNAQSVFDLERDRSRDKLGAVQGMTSLYGTTPALANMYGNQAQDARDFEQNKKTTNRTLGIQALGALRSRY